MSINAMDHPDDAMNERDVSMSSSSYAFNMKVANPHLTLPFILSIKNIYQGHAEKENSWWLAHWFPFLFQLWKPRYLVVVGSYLIRYEDEHSVNPKGKPIPLDVSEIRIDENNKSELVIFNLWKDYKFRFSSEEECVEWARVLKKRKYEAIRENMNHLPVSESGIDLVNKAASRKIDIFMKSIDIDSQGSSVEVFNPLSYSHNPLPHGFS